MKARAGLGLAAALLAGSVWLVVGSALPASAQFEQIRAYHVTIDVQRNGTLAIDERITYDFGDATGKHGILRDIPVVYTWNSKQNRIYRLTVERVTVTGGASNAYGVSKKGADDEIKIGDKNRTVSGVQTYDIAYRVEGALNAFAGHDELYWNVIGDEWDVPISNATARVTVPGTILNVACFEGPSGSSLPCEDQRFDESGSASFGQSSLSFSEGMTVVVGLAKGDVSPAPAPILVDRWSLHRAFSLTPWVVAVSSILLVAFLALFGRLAWKTGRDRRYVGSAVDVALGPGSDAPVRPDQVQAVPLFERSDSQVEFEPPEHILPGEVGTLLDEKAGPLDVSATIVHLAVRGYLTIEEIPKHGLFGKPDWRLTEKKEPDTALKAYESKLLTSLFSGVSESGGGRVVLMSGLRTKFSKKLLVVEDALYDDALAHGWFTARPDKVRARWNGLGWLTLIVGVVLEVFAIRLTKLALLPVSVVVLGLVMIWGADRMPARTAKGTAILRRTLGFRQFVSQGTEAAMAKFAEKQNLFSEYLPYAIVFGVTEKWAKVFEQLTGEPPDTSWYVSPYPFSYMAFSSSMGHFTTTTSGTIASTPAGSGSSGFGGGGFSGGGGGGGGGGSW